MYTIVVIPGDCLVKADEELNVYDYSILQCAMLVAAMTVMCQDNFYIRMYVYEYH